MIPTQRFERTVSFFRDILGFPVLYEGSGYCFLKAGGVNIAIHPVDTDSEFAPTGHGMYLDIMVADLQETRERLSDANIEIQREWKDHTGRFLLIADPNGNLLELIEPVGGG